MAVEILPALRALTEDWVVKKSPLVSPQRLVSEDIDQLARASIETMMQRALGTEDGEWGSLENLTRGWVVQRLRGDIPTPLIGEDYRQFVRFVLDGLVRNPEAQDVTPEALAVYIPENNEMLPDGRCVSDVLKEDPFYFAREHLALSL